MYCEKEKECPIYQIHRELNGHYQRLINELLGKGYYNMGMDAYSCNAESCEEPEKKELLIGAPKEEKQGGKKR